tara:strand:+ start:252 stop:473 length:222 start_codon:yes stop_codon:yes gene_type:complete
MKYAAQTQIALDKLDGSLKRLRDMIKRGENQEALNYMEHGEMKEKFEELQSMVTISQTSTLGARGTNNNAGMF